MEHSEQIALAALGIGAINLNPKNPFQWASGYRMPIYNDNRMFLESPEARGIIIDAFLDLMRNSGINQRRNLVIAGTSTAGIPWASWISDKFELPMIYIRDKPKDHGLKNQIEGGGAERDLSEKRVIVIEDLISTGGSSAAAVQAVRDARGVCEYCFSIFNYGFDEAQEMFDGTRAFNKEGTRFLNPPCKLGSVLDYGILLKVARDRNYITAEQAKLLEEWRVDPWNWGAKRGFPRIIKS